MDLKPGAKLGPYEILARIGEGGMGQVWKARDTRLDRIVAIKTSYNKFSDRFEREAHAVAALNHPHICTLYDVGPDYLVMEYVDGPEIKGPLPLDRVLTLAIQLASALEAAHRKSIIHRDLKPANILSIKSGIKVLDFGLAKIEQAKAVGANDETVTRALTQEGSIVGTLQYMAPEQLQAKATDARADIFSFGCVLYEMLTGKRPFDATNTASVIAAILERPAPSVEGVAPASLDWVLQRCLAKDPDERWQTARDLRAALERISQVAVEALPDKRRQPRFLWLGATAFMLALSLAALAAIHFREKAAPAPDPLQFSIHLPDKVSFTSTGIFVLSPDGRRIAFSAADANGPEVWIQELGSDNAHALPDAITGSQSPPFFWSPDSNFVVFSGLRKIRKADLRNDTSEDICDKPGPPVGGDWNRDGIIIFGSTTTGLWRVPAAGGTAVPLTTLDASRQEISHELPSFLPDGVHFIYFANSRDTSQKGEYVGSLSDPPNQKPKRILATQVGAGLVRGGANASSIVRLLFLNNEALTEQDFDTAKLEMRGTPSPLSIHAGTTFQTGYFSATKDLLVYRQPANEQLRFNWVDAASGKIVDAVGDPGLISEPRISPDATHVVYRRDSSDRSTSDIWILDLARGSSSRLTFGDKDYEWPIWSPDGTEIAYTALKDKKFQIFRKRADGIGDAQPMVQVADHARPRDWSADGNFLLFDTSSTPNFSREAIWMLPLAPGSKPVLVVSSQFDESEPEFSPDGRWIAYESNETGRYEIYVRGVSVSAGGPDSGRSMISKDGGRSPHWRSDGRKIGWLQFRDSGMYAVTADVDTAHGPRAGLPSVQARIPPGSVGGTLTPDLKKVLAMYPENPASSLTSFFNVVVNWNSALKQP